MERHNRIQDVPNFYDYLKHITTLSTGAIVVIITFTEKFAAKPAWPYLFVASIICFLACVLSSLTCMFLVLVAQTKREEPWEAAVVASAFLFSVGTLALGIVALAIYAIRNFGS